MLSASELSAMRDQEEAVMVTSAIIQRYGTASDGMGGFSESWSAVGTVLIDLWPINQRGISELVLGGQITSENGWFLTMPHGTSVTAKDRVLADGKTFEVTLVPSSSQWQTALRVEATLNNLETRL